MNYVSNLLIYDLISPPLTAANAVSNVAKEISLDCKALKAVAPDANNIIATIT